MRSFFRDNSLTIALMGMFSLTLIGMTILGHVNYNQDLLRHHQTPIGLAAYLISGEFLSALFENWESEFLQMGVYVVLTALLVQRGSAESRDPKEVDKEPSNKPRTSFFSAHSLGIVLFSMFTASFLLHVSASFRAASDEARRHGDTAENFLSYLTNAGFWFESFQNWQSEFLSTAVLVVLSIYLREKGSPESKTLDASNDETGSLTPSCCLTNYVDRDRV